MDQFPCDDEYLRTLGRAVYDFIVLDHAVACVINRMERGYLRDHQQRKRSTAGRVADDFKRFADKVGDAELRTKLQALQERFKDLGVDRNGLLHSTPVMLPGGSATLIRERDDGQNGLGEWSFTVLAPVYIAERAAEFRALTNDVLKVLRDEMSGADNDHGGEPEHSSLPEDL